MMKFIEAEENGKKIVINMDNVEYVEKDIIDNEVVGNIFHMTSGRICITKGKIKEVNKSLDLMLNY